MVQTSPPNKNLYNGGSEWQNDTKAINAGVPDYYQTPNRNYDPALARFVAVDPEAEGAASISDYHYAGDNPIMMNDPGGNKLAAGNAWAYISADMSAQAAYQNMYQGSLYKEGPSGLFAGFWNTVNSIGVQIASQEGASSITFSGSEMESLVAQVQGLSSGQQLNLTIYLPAQQSGQYALLDKTASSRNNSNPIQASGLGSPNVNPLNVSVDQDDNDGLTVLQFDPFNVNGVGGLIVKFGYNDTDTGLNNFNFVQTITTNSPMDGATSPYIDPQPPDDDLPFYWTNSELPGYTDTWGYNVMLIDAPYRGIQNGTSWQAELSVVGTDNYGMYNPIITITYGFYFFNNTVFVYPIRTVTPSSFQTDSINFANPL